MNKQQADFAPIRFSTTDLAERDRIPVWREFFGPSVFHTEIEPAPDVPFHAEVTLRTLPDLCLVTQHMSPVCLSRTPAMLADGNDDLGLFVSSSGGTVSQRGREITFNAGDAVIMTATEAATSVSRSAARFRCLHLRRATLKPFVADLDDALLRPIPPNTESLQYLLSYLELLQEDRTLTNPELARLAATHLRDLVALMLGPRSDAAIVAEGRGLRAARLRTIKRNVIENLGNRGLTVVAVAAQHRVTPRYVQRLFESEGTTFSEFLLNQRLARVRNLLSDARYTGWTVSAIALDAGFGDVSYFNRRFRRRYGASPTDVRNNSGG